MLFALAGLVLGFAPIQISPETLVEAGQIVQKSKAYAANVSTCRMADKLAATAEQVIQKQLPQAKEARYPNLLVFSSFSMPMSSLKTLAKQVQVAGGALILRGLVDGSFKKTAVLLKELKAEVLIDPTLFEAFSIQLVPTFVLTEKPYNQQNVGVYDKLSGHVSLAHALEKFSIKGDLSIQALKILETIEHSS